MSSGMNVEQVKEHAGTMTYRQAISNVGSGKFIKYRKATMIKLRELAEMADRQQGEWVQISPAKIYECSVCGQNVMTGDIEAYKWCHGCGCRMKGADNE